MRCLTCSLLVSISSIILGFPRALCLPGIDGLVKRDDPTSFAWEQAETRSKSTWQLDQGDLDAKGASSVFGTPRFPGRPSLNGHTGQSFPLQRVKRPELRGNMGRLFKRRPSEPASPQNEAQERPRMIDPPKL